MKLISLLSCLLALALAAPTTLASVPAPHQPVFASATDSASADRAAQLLARRGEISVQAAGPYVEVGTYRIQVSVKLGRPTSRLDETTWLYENFRAEGSTATGTLIVRFSAGRVTSLTLATPTVVAALRQRHAVGTLVASHDRR